MEELLTRILGEVKSLNHKVVRFEQVQQDISVRFERGQQDLAGRIDEFRENVSIRTDEVQKDVDRVEISLGARIDEVQKDVNRVEKSLGARINEVQKDVNRIEKSLDTRIDEVQRDLTDRFDQRIDKLELRMENELFEKVSALYDARDVQNEINNRVINALDRLNDKIELQQMEIANIRRIK